ncbi:alanine racemase [Sphingomonas sp. YR710]|uniref:alanine racemase n=1 Tax=Sphingomonas sp. YR710 TaxID=1882773 RepID=UPI00088F26C6|nr:alanine racemase [Sphingomonas sp. YR710]SDC63765.1 alanine racemase [Sphingomonas sp. YR710]
MTQPTFPPVEAPLRLILDGAALVDNWRWLHDRGGGAACGAAVKADGYGIGAGNVVRRLHRAGCRDFFVATWAEAVALGHPGDGASLSVLHGVRPADMATAVASHARPTLNSAGMVARWKAAAPARPCDVMIDTGMNRLGLTPAEAVSGLLDGLAIDTLMSHLACADTPESPMNLVQRNAFAQVAAQVPARRYSLANSAGICLGTDFAFDLTRPGLGLYGGEPGPAAAGRIRQVVRIEAEVLQVRSVEAGQTIGYGATFTAQASTRAAILNLGYADGYLRGFAGRGSARAGSDRFALAGRVSMDLIAVDIGAADIGEGDWLEVDYRLPEAAIRSGLSQYELLTGLGTRYQRHWTE